MSFRISSFARVGEGESSYEEMQESTFGNDALLRRTLGQRLFSGSFLISGRLIRYAAFGCYGSAKCVNTLCSHLNRNLPTFYIDPNNFNVGNKM